MRFLNNLNYCTAMTSIKIFILFIAAAFVHAQNTPVDFRQYYHTVSSITSNNNLDPQVKILKIDSLQSIYGRLLPNEHRLKGLLYDQIGASDSARKYFNQAIDLGCDIYDKELIEKYQLIPLEAGVFFETNKGHLLLIEHIEKIDQLIRNNGAYVNMKTEQSQSLDTLNGGLVLRNDLLKESISGYLQRSCILILYHAWFLYKVDSVNIEAHLLNLVIQGELKPYVMAHLIDYWNNTIYGYQIYGTLGNAYGAVFEFYAPFKVANVETIDEMRKSIGLISLLKQVKSFECENYEGFVQFEKY